MPCGINDPIACVEEAVQETAGHLGGSILKSLADGFAESYDWLTKNLTSAWLSTPTPPMEGQGSAVGWLLGNTQFIVAATAVLACFYAAYRLATTQEWSHLQDLWDAMWRLVIAGGGVTFLLSAAVAAGDVWCDWILSQVEVKPGVILLSVFASSPGILLIIALLCIVIQIFQFFIMMARNAMLVYVAAGIPIAAAASNMNAGKHSYDKLVGWAIAFTLYKPVAATIYAGAGKMISGDSDLVTQMAGVMAMGIAIIALPGLMKLAVPVVGAMSGGHAGRAAVALTGAAAAVGAVMLTGGASAAASGGAAAGGSSGVAGGTTAGGAEQVAAQSAPTQATGADVSQSGATAQGADGGMSGSRAGSVNWIDLSERAASGAQAASNTIPREDD